MANVQVLIAEDEAVVAMDIRSKLEDLGYSVAGVVRSGKDAVRAAYALNPDLVLMDIRLQGDMDGIEAAGHILDRCYIPVVYLTAHAGEDTLQRAKVTEPSGYVVKPFSQEELHVAIEMGRFSNK